MPDISQTKPNVSPNGFKTWSFTVCSLSSSHAGRVCFDSMSFYFFTVMGRVCEIHILCTIPGVFQARAMWDRWLFGRISIFLPQSWGSPCSGLDCRSPFSYVLFSFWGWSGKDRLTCNSSSTLMQRSSPSKEPCRFSLGSMLVKGCLGKAGQKTCPLPQSTLEETPLLPVLGSLILSNASLLRQDCHHSLH